MSRFGEWSIQSIEENVVESEPKNTKSNRQYIWRQFMDFCKAKGYFLDKEMSISVLAKILTEWAFNMRKQNGQEYKDFTIKTIWNVTAKLLMEKYYKEYGIIFNPFTDIEFKSARDAKQTKRKQLQTIPEKRKESSVFLKGDEYKNLVQNCDEETPDGLQKKHKMSDSENRTLRILALFLLAISTSNSKEEAKSRQKRLLWVTQDGRLALPPGTTLVISPSLSLPFVRYPPEGFFSNLTISLPFTIDFNKLGLTDNENPYGVLPPLLARSMGRAAGNVLAKYIGSMLDRRRGKRSAEEIPANPHSDAFHGGERALLYVMVEELLENFGMDGRACLLRAICEVHAHPMKHYGLLGEMLKLFFSASKSPYSEMLNEYVEAENAGTGKEGGPSECWPYMKECPKSLFMSKHNHYSDMEENEVEMDTAHEDIHKSSKVTYNPSINM